MTLKTLSVALLAPLAALFLNVETPAFAHDDHHRYRGHHEDGGFHRDRVYRDFQSHRFRHPGQRAHRYYLRKQRKHLRKHRRALGNYRLRHHQYRRHRGGYVYFGW